MGGRASAGARGVSRARLILTVRVTATARQQDPYLGADERTGGTVIGRQGLSLTVRVTQGPVTLVTACYKNPVTRFRHGLQKFPYINQ